MVKVILPPTAALEAAAAELIRSATNVKRHIAVNKALYDLLVNVPAIVRVSGAYLVPSSSRGGVIHRVDDVAGCTCEAGRNGRSCRHAVALELIERAQVHTMPALPKLNDRISRARAEAEAARLALLECF